MYTISFYLFLSSRSLNVLELVVDITYDMFGNPSRTSISIKNLDSGGSVLSLIPFLLLYYKLSGSLVLVLASCFMISANYSTPL